METTQVENRAEQVKQAKEWAVERYKLLADGYGLSADITGPLVGEDPTGPSKFRGEMRKIQDSYRRTAEYFSGRNPLGDLGAMYHLLTDRRVAVEAAKAGRHDYETQSQIPKIDLLLDEITEHSPLGARIFRPLIKREVSAAETQPG